MIVSQQKTQRSITEILDASENKRLETDEYEDDFEELDEDEVSVPLNLCFSRIEGGPRFRMWQILICRGSVRRRSNVASQEESRMISRLIMIKVLLAPRVS